VALIFIVILSAVYLFLFYLTSFSLSFSGR